VYGGEGAGGRAQVVERLPRNPEELSSSCQYYQNRKVFFLKEGKNKMVKNNDKHIYSDNIANLQHMHW
jgi:hypothetical protein